MRLTSIEKSAFHRGEYVGYCKGNVYLIRKIKPTESRIKCGKWLATNRDNLNDIVYADSLQVLDHMMWRHTSVFKSA